MSKQYKLAYFVSHPIQYQAPLLKKISAEKNIDLHVFFLTNPATQNHTDKGFNTKIKWDTPLLDGYQYTFLNSKLKNQDYSLTNPSVKLCSVKNALEKEPWDAVWVHGYNNIALLYIIWRCVKTKTPLLFRAESNLLCSPQNIKKNIFIKWLVKNCSGLLWIGQDNRDYYRHYGAAEKKLFFTPYAVDNVFFQDHGLKSIKPNTDERKCVLLFASKFIKRKQAPLLLEAFAQLAKPLRDQTELWFVGDGPERIILEQRINELQLTNQVFLNGFLNQSELPSVISQCDVFILPSEKEPYGLIINEVMNLAKPIITTDEVGAARDLVEHKQNGWIIPARDVHALTEALAEAVINRESLSAMGKHSLDKINQWSFVEDIAGIQSALRSIQPH